MSGQNSQVCEEASIKMVMNTKAASSTAFNILKFNFDSIGEEETPKLGNQVTVKESFIQFICTKILMQITRRISISNQIETGDYNGDYSAFINCT